MVFGTLFSVRFGPKNRVEITGSDVLAVCNAPIPTSRYKMSMMPAAGEIEKTMPGWSVFDTGDEPGVVFGTLFSGQIWAQKTVLRLLVAMSLQSGARNGTDQSYISDPMPVRRVKLGKRCRQVGIRQVGRRD